MAKLEKLAALQAVLKKKKAEMLGTSPVVVGFTQSYALIVHENLEAFHPVGQAKYLEEPARTLQKELGDITKSHVVSGGSLQDGLLKAGLRLQREAQELTPVDTGALRASAFTAKQEDVEQASADAYAKGQKILKKAGK